MRRGQGLDVEHIEPGSGDGAGAQGLDGGVQAALPAAGRHRIPQRHPVAAQRLQTFCIRPRKQVHLAEQRARLLDADGKELFTTRVSTGRKGFSTPTGEFVITDKNRDWTSTIYHASMPYFQRLNCSDFGLHQGNVPGYPASHGCIRVPEGNAAKLFTLTQAGDRVVILP